MPPFLLANASTIAAVTVAAALFLLGGVKLGLGMTGMVLVGLALVTALLAALVFVLDNRLKTQSQQSRNARASVERMQAMLASSPAGYCLFTPQGILRETQRAPQILGIPKIAHTEDIVGSLKDAPAFFDAFRKLQQTGQSFDILAETSTGKHVQIAGRRMRVGRDGPLIDALWFADNQAAAQALQKQISALNDAQQRANETHNLFDQVPFPVWTRSGDLNITMCNKAYAKTLDTAPEEVLRTQHELISQTAKGGSGRALAESAQAAGEARNERRHIIVAGKRRLLDITELPLKNETGNITGLLGFATDVTAEEDKDTELERHLTAQREVLEHLGSAIAIYGPDMRLEFYNRAYQRLWGADEAFLNGKPGFGEILEDLRTRRRAPEQTDFQRYKNERIALFTSLLEPREDLMHLPDGTTLRILAVPHPMGGIMFVHEDVTDKLALESSYNTLIAVQRETLDNLAEGIAVFGPDGKLRLFNPAFAHIWKLPPDFLGKNPHVADLLEHMKPLFDFGANWSAFKSEMVAYTLDRNPRKGRIERADQAIIEYGTVPLPDGAVLNSYLDVTDSIRVEQALRASNAALATADRLKSEFVANVSYQLRTPLNTVMGFAEILTNQYFGTLNERQMDYTRNILEASRKLLLLINDVLDLATIEAGRMALNTGVVNIAGLLNAAMHMTAEWARQQALEISVDCPPDIGTFEGDENRMKQVLFNLIGNAIKYTPKGGHITLEARRQDAWVILAVADTGIGIPAPDRERVFGTFERANAQARQSGAGLGLSLVKNFVELHGGHIEIESEPGKGTRVMCVLPVKAEDSINSDVIPEKIATAS